MAVTLQDIAKRANVSAATVSSVVNNKRGTIRIGKVTKKRIEKLVKEMGYTPDLSARALRTNRSNLIGVVVANMEELIFGRIAGVIENVLSENGYHCLFSAAESRVEAGKFYLNLLNSYRVDATIIIGSVADVLNDEDIKALTQGGLKTITVCLGDEPNGTSFIDVDNVYGSYIATQHLIEFGHRRIMYVGPPIELTGKRMLHDMQRLEGYQQAMRDAGIGDGLDIPAVMPNDNATNPDCGYSTMKEFLAHASQRPTAVICFNDSMAFGIVQAIKESGLKIPDDISVVGFDDLPWSAYCDPPLTTLPFPTGEIGQMAARMAIDAVQGSNSVPHGVLIKPRLIKRRSTGLANNQNR